MPLGEWGISPTTCSREKEPKIKATRGMLKGNAVASLWLFPLHFSSLKPLESPAVKLFNIFLAFIFELKCQFFREAFSDFQKVWPLAHTHMCSLTAVHFSFKALIITMCNCTFIL